MRTLKPIIRREIGQGDLGARLERGVTVLRHLVIRDFDFSGRSLLKAEIYNVVLERCHFRKTVLSGSLLGELTALAADFRCLRCEDGDIVWSDLRRARFDGAFLKRIYFFNCDLAEASFRQADLAGANFLQCDLSDADFSQAALDAARFMDCRAKGVIGLDQRRLSYEPALFSQKNWT